MVYLYVTFSVEFWFLQIAWFWESSICEFWDWFCRFVCVSSSVHAFLCYLIIDNFDRPGILFFSFFILIFGYYAMRLRFILECREYCIEFALSFSVVQGNLLLYIAYMLVFEFFELQILSKLQIDFADVICSN